MLLAVIALMAVDSTIAIIGGQDAARSQFPYFAHLKTHQAKYNHWTGETKVISLYYSKMYMYILYLLRMGER